MPWLQLGPLCSGLAPSLQPPRQHLTFSPLENAATEGKDAIPTCKSTGDSVAHCTPRLLFFSQHYTLSSSVFPGVIALHMM